jgi:hypothetical protein
MIFEFRKTAWVGRLRSLFDASRPALGTKLVTVAYLVEGTAK